MGRGATNKYIIISILVVVVVISAIILYGFQERWGLICQIKHCVGVANIYGIPLNEWEYSVMHYIPNDWSSIVRSNWRL